MPQPNFSKHKTLEVYAVAELLEKEHEGSPRVYWLNRFASEGLFCSYLGKDFMLGGMNAANSMLNVLSLPLSHFDEDRYLYDDSHKSGRSVVVKYFRTVS